MTGRAVLFLLAMGASLCAGAAWAEEDAGSLDSLARNASCLIEAQTVVKLASQAQGVLAKVDVRRGDSVKAGQVIATLESSVEEAQLKAVRLKAETDALIQSKNTELTIAKSKLLRQQGLQAKNIATLPTLEQAETDVAVLESQLKEAELDKQIAAIDTERMTAVLERRIMRSPIDGIVVSVDHASGEYADLSTVIATLAEVQPLKVKVYLPLPAYPLVSLGMKAVVTPVGPLSGTYEAEVTQKDRQIDAESNLFQAQLNLPNPDLAIPAGLRCEVSFRSKP